MAPPSSRKQVEAIRDAGAPDGAAIEAGLPTDDEIKAAKAQKDAENQPLTYSVAELKAQPELTGAIAPDLAGALIDRDDDERLSVEDTLKLVARFQQRPVNADPEAVLEAAKDPDALPDGIDDMNAAETAALISNPPDGVDPALVWAHEQNRTDLDKPRQDVVRAAKAAGLPGADDDTQGD